MWSGEGPTHPPIPDQVRSDVGSMFVSLSLLGSMPALHTGKIDCTSIGFQMARFALGLISAEEEGDESFPGDPSLPQLNTTGKKLYMIGAGNEAAVAKTCARSDPDRTGSILHACSQLWRDFALHKASQKKYLHLHYLVRGMATSLCFGHSKPYWWSAKRQRPAKWSFLP